jgi:2-methylisocitrate lyase-like PEP mutase family enzyme
MTGDVRERFRELHATGLFVMPNPWDVGSARLLAALGFPALATTSSGHAATYRDAGADVVYAAGLVDVGDIARVVRDVAVAVNVLALPDGPSTSELARVGVRRVSTGGALLKAAYGSLVRAGRELLGAGTSTYAANAITNADLRTAFSAV